MPSGYGSIQGEGGSKNGADPLEATPLIDDDNNGDAIAVAAPSKLPSPSPESERSLWSRLVFQWFVPVLERGNAKKRLDPEDLDLVPLPDDCTTAAVMELFEKHWEEERRRANPSFVRALYRSFGADYLRAGFLKLVNDLCTFVGPQVLNGMILFLRDPDAPLWHGIALTVAVTLSQILMSICLRHYFFKCYTTGLRIRSAVVMTVYRKALTLSASERQTRTLGEITNLTSIDAQRLQDLTTYLHALWYSPLQIALALYFLWRQLGVSSLGGVSVILIMVPVTKFVAQWMGSMQKKLMTAKDVRTELNSEVLAGMKVIKLQAWEESFQRRILDLREVELSNLLRYFVGSSFSTLFWMFTPLAVALATFAVYIWTGHVLDVASALTALALFDILQFPLAMLPRIINNVIEALVSVRRIKSFLMCDEYKPMGANGLDEVGVRMENVSAAYDSKKPRAKDKSRDSTSKKLADADWELALLRSQLQDAEKYIGELTGRQSSNVDEDTTPSLLCLKRIDFACQAGEVIAVVGGVGCGKTSFVNAILGEVRELAGTTSVKGKLAYFSQSPFIMNATLRDNILFGHVEEPVDEERYERALDCCALRHDLELLPHGEATEIGEKGITLSGGQKARIALARAVYHGADITLIDDALSAVDAHVAEHLFEKAIVGELMKPKSAGGVSSQRSVILVTNALQFLNHPMVTKVVVLRDGAIAEQGSYADLAGKDDSVFSRFLSVINETGISGDALEGCEAQGEQEQVERAKRRRSSIREEDTLAKSDSKLMTEEVRQSGHVGLRVYTAWAKAAGGALVPVVILVLYALGEGVSVLTKWFLTYWSVNGNASNQTTYLAYYALINLGTSILGLIKMLTVALFGLKASQKLFEEMLAVVLHAPMAFFDTTPVGRLVNRFSKDVFTIDEKLMETLRTYLSVLFQVASTIVVISAVTPSFSVFLIPMLAFYAWEQSRFTVTYRELKRMDSSNRSPIFALLGESIDGVAVIRSFSAEGSLVRRLSSMLDTQQHAYYLTCTAQSWLAVRLELMGTMIITFTALSAVLEHRILGADEAFAGLAGLALSYALSVTQSLNWSVRMASDMEANMVAVERIQEYTTIESEGDRHTPDDDRLPAGWPLRGEVEFRGAKIRYRHGLPLVLKGLNITIPAGSKVGVVGRTGAGKSTLVVALLRIVELCEGQILIDGQDIRRVGLAKLRNNIAVIPQDPVLYSGTVRTNLDPFGHYTDSRLYETLERVGLYSSDALGSSGHSLQSSAHARVESLDDAISEGGINFSVGQRQLLVIARALLHGSMIVIMDEATAAVDAETDAAIQKVMRKDFMKATVITVAHRLNTIMDSDYILAMSDGRASEFDSPQQLLERGGLFRDLVRAAARD